jgi:hypothetical protein
MSTKGLEHAETAVCIVLWTRDALYSKWVLEAAWKAAKRRMLVQVMIDPIQSPIEEADAEPIDFSAWDGKPAGPAWKAAMSEVRAVAGRPTGKLPLKEEAPPALVMAGLTFVAVATISAGGLPDTRLQGGDAIANLAPDPITAPADATALGGPRVGVHEPASATPIEHVPPVTAHFERLDAAPQIQIIPLKSADEADRDVASADGSPTIADRPNL